MSDSLFDDESLPFLVLINDEHQYSLWPEVIAIPEGWSRAHGPVSRQSCMEWLSHNWIDLRPHSLRQIEGASAS